MENLMRDLLLGLGLTGCVIFVVLAWREPFRGKAMKRWPKLRCPACKRETVEFDSQDNCLYCLSCHSAWYPTDTLRERARKG